MRESNRKFFVTSGDGKLTIRDETGKLFRAVASNTRINAQVNRQIVAREITHVVPGRIVAIDQDNTGIVIDVESKPIEWSRQLAETH
jgi:hypothetical protein